MRDSTVLGETEERGVPLSLKGRLDAGGLLLGILALSLAARILLVFLLGNAVEPLPGIFDQLSYHELAQRVLDGHGFTFPRLWWPYTAAGAPTAHWSYLYTGYLVASYALFGVNPIAARLIQAVAVGLLHPWFTYRIGRRIFGTRAALIAAALSAVYFYFVYYSGALMTEALYIVGILWTIDVAQRLEMTAGRERRRWVEFGAALALTILLRQLFLLFAPIAALWLLYRLRALGALREAVVGLTISALLVIGAILPFTLYNYARFDSFVLLNTNAGFAFFWGNHPIYGTHFEGILPDEGPAYQQLIPQELRTLDEVRLERALLERGIGFVVDDPVRYVLLSISRSREYFKFWPSADSSAISNVARVGSFGLLLPLMLLGLWFAARDGVPPERAVGPGLIYLFMLFYTGIHLLTWTLIRYRLPVDAFLLLFAGLALARLSRRGSLV